MDRKAKAKQMFMQGYSCAQAVACAFVDKTDLTEDQLKKLSISLGGGFVRTHQFCGAMVGIGMVAGYVLGETDENAKLKFYEMFRPVYDKFVMENGTCHCQTLVDNKVEISAKGNLKYATEAEYQGKACLKLVFDCIDLLEEFFASKGH